MTTIGLVMPWGTFSFPLHAYPIVLALGLQNATLQDEDGRSLALTYVTGAVVPASSFVHDASLRSVTS